MSNNFEKLDNNHMRDKVNRSLQLFKLNYQREFPGCSQGRENLNRVQQSAIREATAGSTCKGNTLNRREPFEERGTRRELEICKAFPSSIQHMCMKKKPNVKVRTRKKHMTELVDKGIKTGSITRSRKFGNGGNF